MTGTEDSPSRLVLLMPGQGSQSVGMGASLARARPAARRAFEEVDEALGEPLSRLAWEGPAEALDRTENAQPALFAVSLAVLRAVEAESGGALAARALCLAGHSLGEWSALAAAGALPVASCARLLRLRGEAMRDAAPPSGPGAGGMSAVLGLPLERARAAALAGAEGGRVCVAANDNAEGQVVLSGHLDALDAAEAEARRLGARRVVRLPVSGPFHSPLMAPAARALSEALADAPPARPEAPVVANASAAPESEPGRIRDLLVEQLTAPVRWRETMDRVASLPRPGGDSGAGDGGGGPGGDGSGSLVAELGAGRVLSTLARRRLPGARVLAAGDEEGVAALPPLLESLPAPSGVDRAALARLPGGDAPAAPE